MWRSTYSGIHRVQHQIYKRDIFRVKTCFIGCEKLHKLWFGCHLDTGCFFGCNVFIENNINLAHATLHLELNRLLITQPYKTCRFSHDFELDLFIFHTFSSKFMTLNPPPFPGFPPWPDVSSLSSWSCICASIPTRSSSTLWLIPGDVSIYLHPYFTANDLPTIKRYKRVNYYICWVFLVCNH